VNWLLHVLGLDSGSGTAYLWWSGAGSDISEIALLGGLYGLARKHQCHQPRCWRIGRHVVDGSPYCDHHHQAARERR